VQNSVKLHLRYRLVDAIPKIRARALQIQHLRDLLLTKFSEFSAF